MSLIKTISKYLLAIFMIVAGTIHFVNPTFFLKIMPPYLPLHKELVLVSGIFEVLLGVLLLVPRSSRMAAWGIMALLIAVFPANLYVHNEPVHFQHPHNRVVIHRVWQCPVVVKLADFEHVPNQFGFALSLTFANTEGFVDMITASLICTFSYCSAINKHFRYSLLRPI